MSRRSRRCGRAAVLGRRQSILDRAESAAMGGKPTFRMGANAGYTNCTDHYLVDGGSFSAAC
jgi:hypothetical protein